MRILLLVPPYRTTDALVSQLYPMPLGLVSVGTVLKQAGHDVVLKDFLLPAETHRALAPDSFKGKSAPPYMHYGQEMVECQQWLNSKLGAFDVVGLTSGQCNTFDTMVRLAQHIKYRGKPLVIGGPFASSAPYQVQQLTGADIIVAGEGEIAAPLAFNEAYKGKKLIIALDPPSIDDIPIPDWSLAPISQYPTYQGRIRGVLVASRGCPFNCAFCSVSTVMGKGYRPYSIARVKEELRMLWRHGVRYFCFLDDNLFASAERAYDILNMIYDLRGEIQGFNKARFYMEEGLEVRIAAIPRLLKDLVNVRFDNIAIGLETMDERTRKLAHKPYNQTMMDKALENCKTAGATIKAFYIIGFPGDTVQSVCQDLVEFGKLGLAVRPNNLKLYPGTAMERRYRDEGWIDEAYDWRLSSFYTPTSTGLSYKQIKRLKSVLNAIGQAAEQLGVAVFADTARDIFDALKHKGYKVRLSSTSIRLVSPTAFYRPAPYARLLEILLLRTGANGAYVKRLGPHTLYAEALKAPIDEIQQALSVAIQGQVFAFSVPLMVKYKIT